MSRVFLFPDVISAAYNCILLRKRSTYFPGTITDTLFLQSFTKLTDNSINVWSIILCRINLTKCLIT